MAVLAPFWFSEHKSRTCFRRVDLGGSGKKFSEIGNLPKSTGTRLLHELLVIVRRRNNAPSSMIISVYYHPTFQQIAFFIEETGECGERDVCSTASPSKRRQLESRQGKKEDSKRSTELSVHVPVTAWLFELIPPRW
jgi:hypothetical protein